MRPEDGDDRRLRRLPTTKVGCLGQSSFAHSMFHGLKHFHKGRWGFDPGAQISISDIAAVGRGPCANQQADVLFSGPARRYIGDGILRRLNPRYAH